MSECPSCGKKVPLGWTVCPFCRGEGHQEAAGLRPTVIKRDDKRIEPLVTPEAESFRREAGKMDRWLYHGRIEDYFKEPARGISEVSGFQVMSECLAVASKGSNLSMTEARLMASEFWHALNRRGWVHNEEVMAWVEYTQSLL